MNENKEEYIFEWDYYEGANPDWVTPTESEAEDRIDEVSNWRFVFFNSNPDGNTIEP